MFAFAVPMQTNINLGRMTIYKKNLSSCFVPANAKKIR